jgi:hypothetical protein
MFRCLFVLPMVLAPLQPLMAQKDLYVLIVAVDRFPDKKTKEGRIQGMGDFNGFAKKFRAAINKHSRPLFATINIRAVLGAEATKEAVDKRFSWLQHTAKEGDTVICYITAHGGGGKKDYGMSLANGDLQGDDLRASLAQIRGHVLLILDTCDAGAYLDAQPRDSATGVICACRAKEIAGGELTWSVVDAFSGKAHRGLVHVQDLVVYVCHRVPANTHGKEHPVVYLPKTLLSLPLAEASQTKRRR